MFVIINQITLLTAVLTIQAKNYLFQNFKYFTFYIHHKFTSPPKKTIVGIDLQPT